jgi:DNA-binding transcriptional ArsR family regulator
MLVKQSAGSKAQIALELDGLAVVQALADPVRLGIVRQLAGCTAGGDGLTCGSVSVPVSKSTATHHFKILEAAGIIGQRTEGRCKFLHLRRAELDAAFPGLIDSVLRATADA